MPTHAKINGEIKGKLIKSLLKTLNHYQRINFVVIKV